MADLRPLAVGVLGVPRRATNRQQQEERIGVALKANAEGYALVETFQLMGTTSGDDAGYEAVEALALRLDAQAVILTGTVDHRRIQELTERLRLMVVRVER